MYQANITHSCRFGVPHRTTTGGQAYRTTRSFLPAAEGAYRHAERGYVDFDAIWCQNLAR